MFLARAIGRPAYEIADSTPLRDISWLDLLRPTDDEITRAEQMTGLHIPRREELVEIESSSRHFMRDGAVYLSMPLVHADENDFQSQPIGLVITPQYCISVRYADYAAFDTLGTELAANQTAHTADDTALMLLEAIVNRLADILERLDGNLNNRSRIIFAPERPKQRTKASESLRVSLRELGTSGDLASAIRDSLLGLERMAIYISGDGHYTLPDSLQKRLSILGRDVASLNDFVGQTTNKVQFLLDATLGFISIEQNDGMKLLTVVSSIGITPTLIAGIYGMNFKNIPELQWSFGYWYCLTLMLVSVVIPLLIFWQRGWFGNR